MVLYFHMCVGFQLRNNVSNQNRLTIIKTGMLSRITLNHTKENILDCNMIYCSLSRNMIIMNQRLQQRDQKHRIYQQHKQKYQQQQNKKNRNIRKSIRSLLS